MRGTSTFAARIAGLVTVAVFAVSCSTDRLAPTGPGLPAFASMQTPIALDQMEGALNTGTAWTNGGTHVGKSFDVNPHLGDAIVATFYWQGTSNTIETVTDHLEDGTPVGNTYTLVDYETASGYSMATYVATNVQNFPSPAPDASKLLAVHAIFAAPGIAEGGIMISAYTGVAGVTAQALGAHHSATGTGSTSTVADPGAIAVNAGALVYGVTMATASGELLTLPAGYNNVTTIWDGTIETDGEYQVQGAAGSADPQWTWPFTAPATWFATAVALNPEKPHLAFTVQPSTTLPTLAITPAVQVTALDDQGNVVTGFSDTATMAIGHNGGLLLPGTLSGTLRAVFVNGVATFPDLHIDQLGNGYTLKATAPDATGAESAAFNIGLF